VFCNKEFGAAYLDGEDLLGVKGDIVLLTTTEENVTTSKPSEIPSSSGLLSTMM